MQTTMIVDENFRLKGFNLVVSEVEFLILSIALSRMADSKYVNDKDRAIAERMHNDLYEVGADMNMKSENKIADTPQTDCAEKPNNCKHITEDGVTCAKYPACDDCLDNPLNKVKGFERLVKGSEQTDWRDIVAEQTERIE